MIPDSDRPPAADGNTSSIAPAELINSTLPSAFNCTVPVNATAAPPADWNKPELSCNACTFPGTVAHAEDCPTTGTLCVTVPPETTHVSVSVPDNASSTAGADIFSVAVDELPVCRELSSAVCTLNTPPALDANDADRPVIVVNDDSAVIELVNESVTVNDSVPLVPIVTAPNDSCPDVKPLEIDTDPPSENGEPATSNDADGPTNDSGVDPAGETLANALADDTPDGYVKPRPVGTALATVVEVTEPDGPDGFTDKPAIGASNTTADTPDHAIELESNEADPAVALDDCTVTDPNDPPSTINADDPPAPPATDIAPNPDAPNTNAFASPAAPTRDDTPVNVNPFTSAVDVEVFTPLKDPLPAPLTDHTTVSPLIAGPVKLSLPDPVNETA